MIASAVTLVAIALAASGGTVAIAPQVARPGDAVLVRVRAEGAPAGKLAGSPLTFWRRGNEAWAVGALPIETAPGPAGVEITLPGEPAMAGTLTVVEPGFASKTLRVPGRYVVPPERERARIARDRKAFAEAWHQPFVAPLFSAGFEWPRPEPTGGRFGDQRVLNGKKESVHYGIDIGAPRGAPVHAANDGEVVLARDCYYSGKTVVLWHGAGLFTLYFHMDRIDVRRGRRVARGEKLGVVGSTGRSTGPHLHWSAKVGALYVDPESLLGIDFATGTAPPRRAGPPSAAPPSAPSEEPPAPLVPQAVPKDTAPAPAGATPAARPR
jgi:murein DD-endopeptidase MepM/ murein hydrolase activator NlpD